MAENTSVRSDAIDARQMVILIIVPNAHFCTVTFHMYYLLIILSWHTPLLMCPLYVPLFGPGEKRFSFSPHPSFSSVEIAGCASCRPFGAAVRCP